MKNNSNNSQCDKAAFVSMELAIKRADEINKENNGKAKIRRMRAYKCPKCGLFHLTSMTKFFYNITKDAKSREEYRRKIFIEREALYYEKKFGLI